MSRSRWHDWSISVAGATSFAAGVSWNEWSQHDAAGHLAFTAWLLSSLFSAALLWCLVWLAEKRDAWFARRREASQ